jgi:hypothetical protein
MQGPAPQPALPTLADPPAAKASPLPPPPSVPGPALAPMTIEAVSGIVSAVGIKETPTSTAKGVASLQFVPAPGCGQPRQAGPCENLSPRWFFDSEESKCKDFAFGGCLVRSANPLCGFGVTRQEIPITFELR